MDSRTTDHWIKSTLARPQRTGTAVTFAEPVPMPQRQGRVACNQTKRTTPDIHKQGKSNLTLADM